MILRIFSRSNVAFFVLFMCAVIAFRFTAYLRESDGIVLSAVALMAFCQL